MSPVWAYTALMKQAIIGTAMPWIAIAIFFFVVSSAAQVDNVQQVSDVVISGAGLNDGYINGGVECDSEGQLYRRGAGGARYQAPSSQRQTRLADSGEIVRLSG